MECLISGLGNYVLSPSFAKWYWKKYIPIPGTIMKGIVVPEVSYQLLLLLYLLSFIVDSNSFNSCKV